MKLLSRQTFIVFVAFFFAGCATSELIYFAAPSVLPGSERMHRQMKTAGFWISRHSAPDSVILDEQGITEYNTRLSQSLGLTNDFYNIAASIPGIQLRENLQQNYADFTDSPLFMSNGGVATKLFFEEMAEALNMKGIPPRVAPKFGIVTEYADQRFFPTEEILTAKRFDVEFDELQNSALDIGTPVAIYHTSKDGEWVYTLSPLSEGWVKKNQVALTTQEEVLNFIREESFVVAIAAKSDIYLDEELTRHDGYVRMGARFPLIDQDDNDITAVRMPLRTPSGTLQWTTAYIHTDNLHVGYRPYTARSIIEQAFRLLNQPYGWGGMFGEQDCSRFIQEIYSTVGIQLPRNSSAQARAGKIIKSFPLGTPETDKILAFSKEAPGSIILPMRGHIMLYLGTLSDKAYAIHAGWAYRERSMGRDRIRVFNKVTVSSLDLGKGSAKGSLLERIHSVVSVNTPPIP